MKFFKPNALYQNREKQLGEFYFTLQGKAIAQKTIDFKSIKRVFKEEQAGLIHSWLCRNESESEFYDLLFSIGLSSFETGIYLARKIDIYLIYILYTTLPESLKKRIKLSLDKPLLLSLKEFARSCKKEKDIESLALLKHMINSNSFILSYKRGIKSALLDKKGNFKYMESGISCDSIFEFDFNSFYNKLEKDPLIEKHQQNLDKYIKEKGSFLNDYIINDDDEILAYDENNKKLMKKMEKELSLIAKDKKTKK